MSDEMRVQSFDTLLNWILAELEQNQSIFGIHRSLFHIPRAGAPFSTDIFGHHLATPIGPAAGPHTQLTQNILSSWLSGGRFIELKTVQIMDELEIPRPCIDMEDEGYNVEWSQELKLDQSVDEYVKAWVLIHVLRRLLGFEEVPFGTVFNMSVGYNLEGVQSPPMTRFMDRLQDATAEIAALQVVLAQRFSRFASIEIPAKMVDNVTLSTMHGCPPDEIEQIAKYLMEKRGLHTTVKLNPTLLGKEKVLGILHDYLGFTGIHIPDRVFEHDLQYDRALQLIRSLQAIAAEQGLTFGVKLSNTLAMANHKGALPGDEMYMSGRALYPITINLFHKLAQEFGTDLNVSYSAGADALNLTGILASGALPVTAASDLLKPGGYSRFLHWREQLAQEMQERGAASLEDLAQDRLANLEREAARALENPRYKKAYHPFGLPKVESELGLFDCITAPCSAQCAVLQDVPEYAWLISQGEVDRALEVVLARNPLPGVTGYVCTHLCQERCTRNNYDEPVAIRALKRFATERGQISLQAAKETDHRAAVIGSGPSGLAAAYFLALNGVQTTIYEAKDKPGGMLGIAPIFRLPEAVVREDIGRIEQLGVEIKLSQPIASPPEALLGEGFDAVYIATGAQGSARLGIEGEDGIGVYQALDFLDRASRREPIDLGIRVLVIGGGNTAMDAARTSRRLTGGAVTVVYRRTEQEMPATEEEIEALFAEGIALEELASPTRVVLDGGRVAALACVRNELGEPGPDGRRRPVPVEGSEFEIEADAIIVAIGQRPDVAFLDGSAVALHRSGTILADAQTGLAGVDQVYAGGDAVRGPAIIIEACADGRRAAEAICRQLDVHFAQPDVELPVLTEGEIVQAKLARARKAAQHQGALLPAEQRSGFDLVEQTLAETAALSEATRCLQCSSFCDKCVEVCPNRANFTVAVVQASRTIPRIACQNGGLAIVGQESFSIAQVRQIIHVDDFCNACGNCATFCVRQGSPYLDKPRLFLHREDFEQEDDNAFFVAEDGGRWTIWSRTQGDVARLSMEGESGEMAFENDLLRLDLAPNLQIKGMVLKETFEGEFSLTHAAEMAVVLEGVVASLSFLPLD